MEKGMENLNKPVAQETGVQYPENLSEENKKFREETLNTYNEKGYQAAMDEIANESEQWDNGENYLVQNSDDFGPSSYRDSSKNISDGRKFLSDLTNEIEVLEKNKN